MHAERKQEACPGLVGPDRQGDRSATRKPTRRMEGTRSFLRCLLKLPDPMTLCGAVDFLTARIHQGLELSGRFWLSDQACTFTAEVLAVGRGPRGG